MKKRSISACKRLLMLVLLLVLMVTLPACSPSDDVSSEPSRPSSSRATVEAPSEDEIEGTVVYITETGEKYHREHCQYLSKSKIPISLEDAIAAGYGRCSRCKPPIS